MKKDDIYHDPLLLRLGSFLYERKNIPEVVQNMRQIGRLMKIIRKKKKKKKLSLTEMLIPQNFGQLMTATKKLCFEDDVPSLAKNIKYALQKVIHLQRGIYMKSGRFKEEKILKRTLSLIDIEWPIRISSRAKEINLERQRYKEVVLKKRYKEVYYIFAQTQFRAETRLRKKI